MGANFLLFFCSFSCIYSSYCFCRSWNYLSYLWNRGTLLLYSLCRYSWNLASFSNLYCDKALISSTFLSACFFAFAFLLSAFYCSFLRSLYYLLSYRAAILSSMLLIFACLASLYFWRVSSFLLISIYFSGLWPWFVKISSATFLYWFMSPSIVTFVFYCSFFTRSIVSSSRSTSCFFCSTSLSYGFAPFGFAFWSSLLYFYYLFGLSFTLSLPICLPLDLSVSLALSLFLSVFGSTGSGDLPYLGSFWG